MKRTRFLVLMIVMIIGLFSMAYAETETGITGNDMDAADAEIGEAIDPVVPAPMQPPATPVIPQTLPKKGELLNWWEVGSQAIPLGQDVTIVDVKTGIFFKAMRTYGNNHADMETLSNADTLKMVELWGGKWNWERRAVVVISNGRAIAASVAGMPHAGLDKAPACSTVRGRSGGFGSGDNLDKIKNNGLDGVFDLHLLNSRTHGTNRVDGQHQAAIRVAAGQ